MQMYQKRSASLCRAKCSSIGTLSAKTSLDASIPRFLASLYKLPTDHLFDFRIKERCPLHFGVSAPYIEF